MTIFRRGRFDAAPVTNDNEATIAKANYGVRRTDSPQLPIHKTNMSSKATNMLRVSLLFLVTLIALPIAATRRASAEDAARPNVIFIMADDLC